MVEPWSGDHDAQVTRAVGLLQHHTDDPAAEAAARVIRRLADDHRRCRELFDDSPEPYVITDRRGTLEQLNRRATTLVGPSVGDRGLSDLAHPDDREALEDTLRALDDGDHPRRTLRCLTSEGEWLLEAQACSLRSRRTLWLLHDGSGVDDDTGDGVVALASQDRAAMERLRELDRIRSTFLLTVAHDLRTPLATIVGLADLLSDLGLPDDARKNLSRKLGDVARQVFSDFNNLLDVERLERGDRAIQRRDIDVARILREVASGLDVGARHLQLELAPTQAEVDPVLLSRMVHNLLQNATRHTPEGSTIWLRCVRDDEDLQVTVEDDGPGIPAEHRDAVFEPFARRGDHPGGFGIGLHLVRRFAELHGGEVGLGARPGGGASFRIRLPAPRRPLR